MSDQRIAPIPVRSPRKLLAAAGCLLALSPVALASQQPAWAAVSLLTPSNVGAQAQPDLGFMTHRPATIFHVATTGSDANPGTADWPWRTIGKAVSALKPGQAVYVHGGTYNERITTASANAGTATAPIWLSEAPGETVVITGSSTTGGPFIRLARPYWVVDGFDVNAHRVQAHAVRFETTHHVVARNVDVYNGTGNAAVVFHRSQDAALLSSKVHDYTWTESDGTPKDSHGVAVYGGSQRILIKGNDSWGHSGDDVQCVDQDGVTSADDPADITIEGNRYGNTHPGRAPRTRTRENAVDIKTCKRVTVTGNKMFGFRPASTAPGGAALVAHMNADRVLIQGNRFWDIGIAASLGSQGNCCLGSVVFRRNLVFDTTTASNGSGDGIRVAPATRFEAYHNTFSNIGGHALVLGDTSRVAHAVVIDNIVDHTAGTAIHAYLPHLPRLVSDRNLFGSAPLPRGWPYDAGSLFEDPQFVDDPRANDFYTLPTSPARDTALREPLAVDPAHTTYCGGGPDIGFLETC